MKDKNKYFDTYCRCLTNILYHKRKNSDIITNISKRDWSPLNMSIKNNVKL